MIKYIFNLYIKYFNILIYITTLNVYNISYQIDIGHFPVPHYALTIFEIT